MAEIFQMVRKFVFNISPIAWDISCLTLLAGIAFFFGLGNVHLFDWDEINFAEAAREMLVTGNYGQVQINFEPFYEKPPLFFWLQALSMHIWGINEFAARFPNALCGVITVLTLYLIGSREKDKNFGLCWSLIHLSALLPHFYFKTGIIDPVFNYFILLGIYGIVKLYNNPKSRIATIWSFIGGLSMGASILTKGPVGFLIASLIVCCYWLQQHKNPFCSWARCMIYFCSVCILPVAWLSYETYQHGTSFITNFLANHIDLFSQPIAGHSQPFYYHFLVVFFGCFPASILALKSLVTRHFGDRSTMLSIMIMLFWIVMILFSLSTTKIVHYSSLAYFPISFLAAHHLYQIEQNKVISLKWTKRGLWIIGSLISIVFIALPIVALNKRWFYPFIHHQFMLACIDLPVNWHIQDCATGCSYVVFTVIALYCFNSRLLRAFLLASVMATTSCIALATMHIVPKIEQHIQGPAIAFYQQLVGESVYVTTVGFKSYAPFFYGQKAPDPSKAVGSRTSWMIGRLPYPVYFVVKVDDLEDLLQYNSMQLLYIQGGFAFLKREQIG